YAPSGPSRSAAIVISFIKIEFFDHTRTTPAYRDGLRAVPPNGVLRPAQLSILDEIRLGGHFNFCLNPKAIARSGTRYTSISPCRLIATFLSHCRGTFQTHVVGKSRRLGGRKFARLNLLMPRVSMG